MYPKDQNERLAAVFEEVANLLSFKGEVGFKIAAYSRFTGILRQLDEPIGAVAARGELDKIPGAGPAIAKKTEVWLETGTFPLLERLHEEVSQGVRELIAQGLPPSVVRVASRELDVKHASDLRQAIAEGRTQRLRLRRDQREALDEWARR